MKRPMKTAQWSDCETDEERAEFFRSGRAWLAGNTTLLVCEPIAKAFEDAAKWRKLVGVSRARRVPPPWGPDAVPLMACPVAGSMPKCDQCAHAGMHAMIDDGMCAAGTIFGCPACVQVGWRERSKP